jgi:hypothetical protein
MSGTANVKGTNVALLDTTNPFAALDAGAGRAARLKVVEDKVNLDATALGGTDTYARLCRVPANAKIKKVEVWSDSVLDSNATSTLKLRFGMGFSDSEIDGTPAAYRGKNPSASLDGTVTAATTSNALFGDIDKSTTDNTKIPVTEITFNGAVVTDFLSLMQKGLAKLFAFVTGQGQDQGCPGYMDLTVHVVTAAATAAAGNLYARVHYAE